MSVKHMKTIRYRNSWDMLHIETPLGIVNITVGLSDSRGRRVESIEVIPNRYKGERKVLRSGYANTRLIECRKVRA